jgi:hypothetical protein
MFLYYNTTAWYSLTNLSKVFKYKSYNLTSNMRFRNEANRILSSETMDRYLMPAMLQKQQLSSRTNIDLDLKQLLSFVV